MNWNTVVIKENPRGDPNGCYYCGSAGTSYWVYPEDENWSRSIAVWCCSDCLDKQESKDFSDDYQFARRVVTEELMFRREKYVQ